MLNDPVLLNYHKALTSHSMYRKISNLTNLKIMMETHVFAVWDFMSLLKRLQREITCVNVPWTPSHYSKKLVRLLNEIVLGEESDLDPDGEPIDHFSLYIRAMEEVGADSSKLFEFIKNNNYDLLTKAQQDFVRFNIELACFGKLHEVASVFFFGREKLIPDMFTSLLSNLKKNLNSHQFSNLIFYLERHIQVDGEEHSHLAYDCLKALCGDDAQKWSEAKETGLQSLKLRKLLWDDVEKRLLHHSPMELSI